MSLWNRDDVQSASMFHFITAKVMQGLYCLAMKRMQSAACEVVSKTERGKVMQLGSHFDILVNSTESKVRNFPCGCKAL